MTTEAGKRLLEAVRPWYPATAITPGLLPDMIAAIEAEAVAAERARIAEGVRGLRLEPADEADERRPVPIYRAAVLAIIEEMP